jgi:hypothetical protein
MTEFIDMVNELLQVISLLLDAKASALLFSLYFLPCFPPSLAYGTGRRYEDA